MRRAISLAIALIAAANVALAAGFSSQVTVPEWVLRLASKPPRPYPPRTNAVVLLNQMTVSYTKPTEYVETTRRVVRILRPEGREERNFSSHYLSGDKVESVHAWSINPAGYKFELKEKEFITQSPFGSDILYSDEQSVTGDVPGADVGSVIAFESVITRRVLANQLNWSFQEDLPVEESRFAIDLPAGWEFKSFWANTTPAEPITSGKRVEWVKTDLPEIKSEISSPAPESLYAKIAVAVFGPSTQRLDSWDAIGSWNQSLISDRRLPTPEIAAKSRQLTSSSPGFDTSVRALAEFLQKNFRYVAIEIGIGGHQPHYASEVFKYRYGDCKDKATLLAAMLQAAGISSHLVLIDTRYDFTRKEMPTINFNHEILAIDLPDDAPVYSATVISKSGKKYLVFDPTDDLTPIGQLNPHLQGSFGLLTLENGGELVRMPVVEAASNRTERIGNFVLSSDGALSGDIVEMRSGHNAWAWRSSLKQSNESDRTRTIEHYFGLSVKGMALKESTFENLDQLTQDLISRYKVTADRYAQSSGPLFLVRPRVLGTLALHIDWKERKHPVYLDASQRIVDSYDIQLPDGYVIDDMPDPVKIDVGFASYQSRYENTGKSIHYWREYVVKDPFIPNEKLADLHKLQDQIGRDEFATVVLKAK